MIKHYAQTFKCRDILFPKRVPQSLNLIVNQSLISSKRHSTKKAIQQYSFTLINQETESDLSVFESTVTYECS